MSSSLHSLCFSFTLLMMVFSNATDPLQPSGGPLSSSAFSSLVSSVSPSTSDVNGRSEHVCSNIDIRNQISYFRKLANCTVVEGFLQIILIEHSEESEFAQFSFPKLREVTGYLLLYRVYGLKTLSKLFPNLTVIRGRVLFYHYALVVFELPHLEELGLYSLTRIIRGGVRMEKNPQLCYIDTIDWSKIQGFVIEQETNFILQNKDIEECPNVCPKELKCPKLDATQSTEDRGEQLLCWNAEKCQKICSPPCPGNVCYKTNNSGQSETKCCHPQCVGGCTGPSDTECIACAKFVYNGTCLSECPANTFEYHDRRCVSEAECIKLSRLLRTGSLKLHEGKCREDCPSGYMESKENRHQCEKCVLHCPKVCRSIVVDNLAAAQKLKGCTIIDGILDIQIRGGSFIGAELEENLGMIEEVRHYLKIVRSYALVSLRFLKSLKVIRGTHLHANRYAMFILDNQNLQDLWDFETHPNITIENGSLFFHFNRKLCMSKINALLDFVHKRDKVDGNDISEKSNGDQIACDMTELIVDIMTVNSEYAIIKWQNTPKADARELLSWVINYRKVTEENITIYSSRDACGTEVWKTVDVRPDSDNSSAHIATIIYNLEPYTKYALFVQTYSIVTAKAGAMSKIMYFMTKPETPTPARDITVSAKYPGELHVTWKPPQKPNGNVTHYYIYWQLQSLTVEKFHQRDYCTDRLRLPSKPKETTVEHVEKNITNDGTCCACPKTKQEQSVEEWERRYQIEFENFLHNTVYRKELSSMIPTTLRKKRDSDLHKSGVKRKKRYSVNQSDVENYAKRNPNLYKGLIRNSSETTSPIGHDDSDGQVSPTEENYEAAIIYGKTEFILTNLKHFQEYSIEVIACHEYMEGITEKLCSNRAIISGRTLPNASADIIDPRNITVTNSSDEMESPDVIFTWKEPESPNGVIVVYEIELDNTDVPNHKLFILCIQHQEYIKGKGSFAVSNLKAGTWTFRLRATSLAGPGPWTEYRDFYVQAVITTSSSDMSFIIAMVLGMVGFVVIFVIVVACVVRRKINAQLKESNLERVTYNPNYALDKEYVPDEWEVDREKIDISRELGQGSFGMVYEGVAHDLNEKEPLLRVAIKTVNADATIHDRYSFLNEASIMKGFNSFHVVKLLGVVSKGQPVLVVMELMSNGDLKTYLRSRRPEEETGTDFMGPPTLAELLKWAGEIADGMAYLSSMKYVHRDLAARNCMVSDDLVVKIGDFGLTRDIYATDYYRKGTKGLLPVRWMAPESLRDGIFTSRSDVWSYGVVIWEMATLAAQPYQGLSNDQVLQYVGDGSIMDRPTGCPDQLYKLMSWCWRMHPKERPAFNDIIEALSPDLPQSFHENSFYFKEQSDEEDDFASAENIADKEMGLDEDVDDSDLIHSKTPLHPTKSFTPDLSTNVFLTDGGEMPDLFLNSRGIPMPIQMPNSTVEMPLLLSHRKVSGSISSLNDKTPLCNLDSNETSKGLVADDIAPQPPQYGKACLVENTTNDKLSYPIANHTSKLNSLGVVSDSQPDIICGGHVGSQDNIKANVHPRGLHKNGLVNGLAPPPYSYRTPSPC